MGVLSVWRDRITPIQIDMAVSLARHVRPSIHKHNKHGAIALSTNERLKRYIRIYSPSFKSNMIEAI